MTGGYQDSGDRQDLAGIAPPGLLHLRPIPDAEEVLVLTFTCDLSFVEDVCVRQARTTGARVTIVFDADRVVGGTSRSGPAIGEYVPVPVVCRSGGAFHPKLVVIASPNDAVVAIGSGNVTASGWHHNAEVWTTGSWPGPRRPRSAGRRPPGTTMGK